MIDFTVLIPVYNTNPIDLIECVYSVHWTNQTIKQEYDIVLVDDGSDYVGTLNALEFIKQIKQFAYKAIGEMLLKYYEQKKEA